MAYKPTSKLSKLGEGHPPNLVPIMNLFLVLIPMLITMTVAVKLAVMNINLPSAGGTGEETAEKENKPEELENLIIVISEKEGIIILGYAEGITSTNKFVGGGKQGIRIPKEDIEYNLHALEDYIKEIKEKYEDQKTISFACDDTIEYGNLIKAMDLCRRNGLPELGIVDLRTITVKY